MKNFLAYASKRYYEGAPIISDPEFDALATLHDFQDVGYTSSSNKVEHMYPMFSLQKVFHGETPPKYSTAVVTPKLDGAAVSLLFCEGNLRLALTRGDGTKGIDITEKLQYLVPESIPIDFAAQITGEVVAPATIPNARNYAAGALGLKSIEEFRSRELTFVAYDCKPYLESKWSDAIALLREWGFRTVLDSVAEFPQDGLVFREDDYFTFESHGYTARHPKGAYAYKEIKEGVITTLREVTWQVGRTGVISPVAICDPVEIEGAVVSRATLHNIAHIEALGLEIGCQVELIRSGEIIPKIIRRVN